MDLRPVVNHIKSSFWIDLDDDQVSVHAWSTLGEHHTSRSARNGLDLDHSPIFCVGINAFRHCPTEVQPESPSNQDLSTVAQLLIAGKKFLPGISASSCREISKSCLIRLETLRLLIEI